MTAGDEIAAMKDRIHNLELALHGLWALLRDIQPPATQQDADRLFAEHFDLSRRAGGFQSAVFAGYAVQNESPDNDGSTAYRRN